MEKAESKAELLRVGNPSSWANVYRRIDEKRREADLTWNQLAALAGIKVKSWMTGIPTSHPTENEVRKIAKVPQMNTTYEYLRYGTEPEATA
ncbi:MAG: helix-turn-helix transcriptional regulator [Acidaminococcaceae bacterium]|nr:helix-turn-helix transcriptional regulator [Acidaminococcaceae bacterium]